MQDFNKYYDQCYCLFDYFNIIPKCEKMRKINDLAVITDEENRIPFKIYIYN